jgi:CPA2 family monovalent cation:H+ antiporter-2
MAEAPLVHTFLIVLAAVCAVGIIAALRLPAPLGYVLAGIAMGTHGLDLIATNEELVFLAELGVIFLMLMIGLEFSLSNLGDARRNALWGGVLQVGLTVLIVATAAVAWGWAWPNALVLGGAVAMSSTAIASKQLADQSELTTAHGYLALTTLLFQDLMSMPFLALLGAAKEGAQPSFWQVVRQITIAVLFIAGTAAIAKPVIRAALGWVARARSTEFFLLSVLLIAFGAAYAANLAGVSAPIGAFLAGVVIGESDFRHQVQDDIRPFRDVLLGLFFMTTGMQVDPSVLASQPAVVLAWIVVFTFGKAAILLVVAAILKWPREIALRVALVMAHGGEFGLLLLSQGMATGLISAETGKPALLALIVTMGLAPVIIKNKSRLLKRLAPSLMLPLDTVLPVNNQELRNHVLICGCGRIGRLVAPALKKAELPYLAIEVDGQRYWEARELGIPILFGDASRAGLLQVAGLPHARLVVVTFDRQPDVRKLLHHLRARSPALPVLVSVSDISQAQQLAYSGAAAIFPESFAAGLALADQALLLAGFTQDEAAQIIRDVRAALSPHLGKVLGL